MNNPLLNTLYKIDVIIENHKYDTYFNMVISSKEKIVAYFTSISKTYNDIIHDARQQIELQLSSLPIEYDDWYFDGESLDKIDG